MAAALQRAWRGRGPLARALLPLSLIYGALAALHRRRVDARPPYRAPVPVVVVGNVVAGGGGKTPVVLALLEHLRSRGLAAGVVSRGHGRTGDGCREVRPDDDAGVAGDEPLLLRRASGAPVFVAARRAEAVAALLEAYPGVSVVVSDDGLQHRALARDLELCVFDGRGVGNGWLLPAGPLREPWPRPVDFVLHHGHPPGIEGFAIERALAPEAVRADGTRAALASLPGPLHATAGVATPEGFFAMLRDRGLVLAATHPRPDHHDYADAADLPTAGSLLCTEKDAVKLWRHRPDAWAVPLEVRLPAAFLAAFDRALDARLSSRHGSQTA